MSGRKNKGWLIFSAIVFLGVLAALLYGAHGVKQDIERWDAYQQAARARGDDLGFKRWLPADPAADEDLFRHPWIQSFIDDEASAEAKAAESMHPWSGLGMDAYEVPVEGASWFEGRGEEMAKVLAAGEARQSDLEAIREEAARPGCRIPFDPDQPLEISSGLRISELGAVLEIHADAAILSGDGETAAADIEALLRLGAHLRGQNKLLTTLVGVRFESRASGLLEVGLTRGGFSQEARQRMLRAMRTRSVPDELANVMRVERGSGGSF